MLIRTKTKEQKLTKRIERFYEDKEAQERLEEFNQERKKIIDLAPDILVMDFYNPRKGDYKCEAYKVVFKSNKILCAKYKPKTNVKAISLNLDGSLGKEIWASPHDYKCITDKHTDSYYKDSKMLHYQGRMAVANGYLLQPGQDGFKTKYGDPNKKLYEKMEKEERAKWQEKQT